jgi:hypothetical protein
MFSFQELFTDPCDVGLCIMLKHEVDKWHDNGPRDLIKVSLCIQIAIDKMQLYSLSVAYACPSHNLTATMGHSVHNVDISKPLIHITPYTLSAICPVQLKPGFICEEHTSPAYQWPSKVSICQLKSFTTPNCSQFKTLVRTTSTQMSIPKTDFDSLCSNSLVVQNHSFISCLGGWSQSIPQVKKTDVKKTYVEVLGRHGYKWSAVVRLVGPFNVPCTRCTCVMIMLFNKLLDMPHLSGRLS